MTINAPIENRVVRCAIYTRKSTDRGLEKDANSLETQRSVCQAYIKCHAHRNWTELPYRYDDGGFSGANLQRPALQRLIADVEAGRIDVIVIYKIDRLSRSLTDFVRLMDVLQRYGASFVSVTQTFDTSDSMGRLVLNILLTFAQFERELMADRVRDKKAEMRRRGLFTGGTPPVGYLRSRTGKLVLDPDWAPLIKEVFQRYPQESAQKLAEDFTARGIMTRTNRAKNGNRHGGQRIWPRTIHSILNNPIYAGYFVHHGEWMPAEVEPLVTREEWDLAHDIMASRYPQIRDPIKNFLLGILHDEAGRRMRVFGSGPGRSNEYRYYKSIKAGWAVGTIHRKIMVSADRVEELAVSTLQALLVDRIKLKQSVLSLGQYSPEIARLLDRGQLASRRLAQMDKAQLREAFLALVPRAEVTKSELRLLISCHELNRFLGWDGKGIFRKTEVLPAMGADRFRMIYSPATLVCGHPYFSLPIGRCREIDCSPDPKLVALLEEAAELQRFMLHNRDKSISELATERGMGASTFARIVRVNYLAPDIQAAIYDGTQPSGLTKRRILYGSQPLDWEQQRQLMGFQ